MNKQRIIGCLLMAIVAGGCEKPSTSATGPTANVDAPVGAQPKLQTMKLWLGAEEMIAELALTIPQQMAGMMFRTNMAENAGMLFVFPGPHRASFWMKNTRLPLSAAYIDPEGVILEIHNLEPQNTNSVTAGSDRVQFVLETNQGWFDRHNIKPGVVIRTEQGSLRETFFHH
jgi:uncharacterized membrane protein (UPF0127 family)